MITMLNNKKVYEKPEIDMQVAALNTEIYETSERLEEEINTKVASVFEYMGPCRYKGTHNINRLPPAEELQKFDIIRCTNGDIIQITATGTQLYKVLNDEIRPGWIFNLTEGCIADNAFIDGYGTLINVNTDIAVVKLDAPVDGCIWGFDAMSDALHLTIDDELSPTSENPVMNRVVTDAINQLDIDISKETERASAVEAALDSAIQTEVTRSTAEDATLTEALNAEVDRAQLAEQELNGAIENEVARATDYEATLNAAIQTEVTRSTAEDTRLNNALNDEVTRSTAEDTRLFTLITNEGVRAQAAESDLSDDISAEVTRAQAAEVSISDALRNESERALYQESVLSSAISTEQTRAETAEGNLSDAISDEATRAQAAEQSLSGAISSEVSRATAAESDLRTYAEAIDSRVDAEQTRAETAEGTLSTAISNEVTRAEAAESDLSDDISAEVTRATTAEGTLDTAISNEVTRAQTAEGTLNTAISNEVTRATTAEGTLNTAISTEVTRAQTAESSLNTAITNLRNEKGVANGIATLDASGRVPYSQLPESAMEFKGKWDTSTNTPTLKDGTGTNGEFYLCSTAGTVNFGTTASPRSITFYVNDRVIYNGTTDQWERIPASDVRSVNGLTGDVTLTASNIDYATGTTVKAKIDTKVDKVSGKGLSTNDFTTALKNKLDGIAAGAQVNQDAFSKVKVGDTVVAADAQTDTLELVAGSNVTLTPDETNDKITIAATDTTYESKAAASGGTAVSLVTTGEKYTWNNKQAAVTGGASTITSSNLTANRALVSNSSGKVAVSTTTSTELEYVHGVTSAIQTQLNAKVPNTRTVNGKALSADVSLVASDIDGVATPADITTAIEALDVASVGGGTKYVSAISETDGKISATVKDVAQTYSASGTTAICGKGVAAALGTLDVASVGGDTKYVSAISETDGKISATVKDVAQTYSASGTTAICGKGVAAALGTLDVASVGGAGKYISAISETDGKISATATTMDTTPTASSTNAVTSGGVQSAIATAETNAKNLANATGTLAVSKGGTGQTTTVAAETSFSSAVYLNSSTAAATAIKEVTASAPINTIGARFVLHCATTNTADSPKLKVTVGSNTYQYTLRYHGSAISKGYLSATRYLEFMILTASSQNGTNGVAELIGDLDTNTTYTAMVDARCDTAASESAKTASGTSVTSLQPGSLVLVRIVNSNSSGTALTFNCGSTGAKPLYINGAPSSTTNYTLNAGTYLFYYDGTNWYVRPDGTFVVPASEVSGVVTGVKGGSESAYRRGDVNITKGNIGLGYAANTYDEYKLVQASNMLLPAVATGNSAGTAFNLFAGTTGQYNSSMQAWRDSVAYGDSLFIPFVFDVAPSSSGWTLTINFGGSDGTTAGMSISSDNVHVITELTSKLPEAGVVYYLVKYTYSPNVMLYYLIDSRYYNPGIHTPNSDAALAKSGYTTLYGNANSNYKHVVIPGLNPNIGASFYVQPFNDNTATGTLYLDVYGGGTDMRYTLVLVNSTLIVSHTYICILGANNIAYLVDSSTQGPASTVYGRLTDGVAYAAIEAKKVRTSDPGSGNYADGDIWIG